MARLGSIGGRLGYQSGEKQGWYQGACTCARGDGQGYGEMVGEPHRGDRGEEGIARARE